MLLIAVLFMCFWDEWSLTYDLNLIVQLCCNKNERFFFIPQIKKADLRVIMGAVTTNTSCTTSVNHDLVVLLSAFQLFKQSVIHIFSIITVALRKNKVNKPSNKWMH